MSTTLGPTSSRTPLRTAVASVALCCLAAGVPGSAGAAPAPSAARTATPAVVPTVAPFARAATPSLTIGTYNVQKNSSSRPWTKRRAKVARLVRQGSPDVLGIQEANGPHKGSTLRFPARDLGRQLGAYSIVQTRTHKGERELSTTGRYLLYRPSRLTPRRSGELSLGHRSHAVWAELADRATGRRLVVVNAHLINGNTAARDRVRRAQTKRLVAAVRRVNTGRLPAVFVGDYNTHSDHRSDAPTKVLAKSGYLDSYRHAQKRVRGSYNSNNQLRRKPPRKYLHADYVYVPRGTTVTSWSQGMLLKDKRFRGTIPSDHNPIFATVRLR